LHIGRGHEEFPDTPLEAITFYARREFGEKCDTLTAGASVHLLAHLEKDQFKRGQPVRLRIISLR
ncbi:hypothetical protein KKG57_00335, partial [Patescibacteria group bacterium]|nr:hypothetical protein [Patescibacteria group bacterium]